MKLKPILLSLFLMFTLSGCYNKFLSFVYYDEEIETVRINGKYPEIEIFDLRQQISERDLKRPGSFTLPGWTDIVYPKLTDEHKKEIRYGIKRHFTNDGDNFKVTCILRNSMQKGSVHFFKERIFVTVEIEIYLNTYNDKLLDSYRTTAYLEHKSMSMLKNYIYLLYNKALRTAVQDCFIGFKKIDNIKSQKEYYRNSRIIKYNK